MENQMLIDEKKKKRYKTFRIIGYIIVAVTLVAYIISLFLLPDPPESEEPAEQIAGEVTFVFFGIIFVELYTLIYAGCNVPAIVLSIICLVNDSKEKNTKNILLDVGLIILPIIFAVIGFFAGLFLKYGS